LQGRKQEKTYTYRVYKIDWRFDYIYQKRISKNYCCKI